LFRNFILSEEGVDTTYCLSFPNKFITAYSSYISGKPTVENIQAITDAEILVISKENLQNIFKNNSNWLIFSKSMAETEYIELEKRIFSLLKNKAKQRYLKLITRLNASIMTIL
jgi:CRP-like cAMP-binding protein